MAVDHHSRCLYSHEGERYRPHGRYLLRIPLGPELLGRSHRPDRPHHHLHRVRRHEGRYDPLHHPDTYPRHRFVPRALPRPLYPRWWKHLGRLDRHDGLLQQAEQRLWHNPHVPLGAGRLHVSGVPWLRSVPRRHHHRFLVLVHRPAHRSACVGPGSWRKQR